MIVLTTIKKTNLIFGLKILKKKKKKKITCNKIDKKSAQNH